MNAKEEIDIEYFIIIISEYARRTTQSTFVLYCVRSLFPFLCAHISLIVLLWASFLSLE